MKTMSLVLMSVLISGASAWAYGPYCGPVPRCGAPVVSVGCYPVPRAVYATPVVYAAPVMYSPPPRVVYVQPMVYRAPVVYERPVCCVSPVVEAIVALPFLFGGHHGGWSHGGGHHR